MICQHILFIQQPHMVGIKLKRNVLFNTENQTNKNKTKNKNQHKLVYADILLLTWTLYFLKNRPSEADSVVSQHSGEVLPEC